VLRSDRDWMVHALNLARLAAEAGEVPVGAVLVREDQILGEGSNASISRHDPTAHAEVLALRQAAKKVGNYRLTGSTMYVTLEPCAMCVGAMVHARVKRVVYAASDPRSGCCGGAMDLIRSPMHNHHIIVDGGLMAEDSANLLRSFFRERRKGAG